MKRTSLNTVIVKRRSVPQLSRRQGSRNDLSEPTEDADEERNLEAIRLIDGDSTDYETTADVGASE